MCFRASPLACLSPWNAAYLPLPRSPSSASDALPTLGRQPGILPHCRPSLFRWSLREVLRAGPVRRVEEKRLCPPATGSSDHAASVSALPVSLHDYSNARCSCYRPALHHRLRHPRRLLSYIISLQLWQLGNTLRILKTNSCHLFTPLHWLSVQQGWCVLASYTVFHILF